MKVCKYTLRIVTFTLLILIFSTICAYAFDLDMTVDDDIRKNYNSSKLVNDTHTEDLEELPELPAQLKKEQSESMSNQPAYTQPKQNSSVSNKQSTYKAPPKQYPKTTGSVKILRGTVFEVVNTGKISDWQRSGTTVRFKTTAPIYKRHYTIPASTVFTGEIKEAHQPQISCNGGLVVIRIKSMTYKGEIIPVNAYITRADGKNIFLNNIKGDRTYLKTVWKKGNWGRSLFNRMCTLTVNLGGDGSTILLSPFPFVYGTICLGANTIISPVTAFFQKGKHVSINAGSKFKIRLLDDAYIN